MGKNTLAVYTPFCTPSRKNKNPGTGIRPVFRDFLISSSKKSPPFSLLAVFSGNLYNKNNDAGGFRAVADVKEKP